MPKGKMNLQKILLFNCQNLVVWGLQEGYLQTTYLWAIKALKYVLKDMFFYKHVSTCSGSKYGFIRKRCMHLESDYRYTSLLVNSL